jgi:outer membrane protein with beta-barrel domain
MTRSIGSFVLALAVSATPALAQETSAGPGTLEITVIPGGATFFTSTDNSPSAPSFGSYNLGATLAYNITRFVGVEGEIGGTLGIAQDLELGGLTSNLKTPNMLNYSGNLVVSAPAAHGIVPYVTGGVGGLSVFSRESLGIPDTTTFLTGNVGAGVKWYAPNGRWGLRGDYRFEAVASKDDAPDFFGRDTRYGHRVYAGVLINAIR